VHAVRGKALGDAGHMREKVPEIKRERERERERERDLKFSQKIK